MAARFRPQLRKVCGITLPEDAGHAAAAGANAVGLIFYAPSPRSVTFERAEAVAAAVPEGVRRVGVFVRERPNVVAATARRVGLDVVQLHGYGSPDELCEVRGAVPEAVEVWMAVRVDERFDASGLSGFRADAFLLDTARPGVHGGTGETFSWHLARRARPYGKVIVAGGLDGDNVAEAVRVARPWGVDSSSRLESTPGAKDPDRVERYLRALL